MELLKECNIKNSGDRGVPISENSRKFLHIRGHDIYSVLFTIYDKIVSKNCYKLYNVGKKHVCSRLIKYHISFMKSIVCRNLKSTLISFWSHCFIARHLKKLKFLETRRQFVQIYWLLCAKENFFNVLFLCTHSVNKANLLPKKMGKGRNVGISNLCTNRKNFIALTFSLNEYEIMTAKINLWIDFAVSWKKFIGEKLCFLM